MASSSQDLQDSLDASWHDEDDFLEQAMHSAPSASSQRGTDLSSLAMNLSSQAEYNNELLQYIHHLEAQFNQAQATQLQQEVLLGEHQKRAEEARMREDDLQRQLHTVTDLYEKLSETNKEHSSELTQSSTAIESLRSAVSDLTQQKQILEESKETSSERIVQLQTEVADLQRRRIISDDDCTDSIATLTIQLEKTNADLERERKLHYELQLSSSLMKDENIQLTRRLEHFVKVGQEDSDERENNARKQRESAVTITSLQQQVSSLSAERDQLEQALTVSRVRLSESEDGRCTAVENAQKTDLIWREMEEVSKQQQSELQNLTRQLSLSAEKVLALEKRLSNSDEKDRHIERMLKEEHDRKTEAMRLKLEDQQNQLNQAHLRLEEVNDRNDEALASSSARIEELNRMLQSSNEQLQTSADALKKQKAEETSHNLQLEKIIHDLRDQLRRAQHDEQGAIKAKVQELIVVREQLAMRGERYSATISGLHDAVHAISAEAMTLRDQLVYMHRQQEKLLVILQQMSSTSHNDDDERLLAHHQGNSKKNLLHGPLHEYCLEMQKTLAGVIEKVKQSKESHESTKLVAEERFSEIQQLHFEKEEIRGQLCLSEETLGITRGKMLRLESQCEEALSDTKAVQAASATERDKLTARLDKSENRVTDMIRQNTTVQADLRRTQAEATAAQNEAEARYNLLSNKLVKIAAERDDAREKEKLADSRHSDLQNQLIQSDARIAKQQADYRKLKKIALSLKEDMTRMTNSSQEQLMSLNNAMEQYRVQLLHKQRLIEALQQQRAELTNGNERLHSLVTELRDERENAIATGAFVPPSTLQQLGKSSGHFPSASVNAAMKGFISSSTASSSRQALSGLAQLVHSASSANQPNRPHPRNISVAHGTNIGSGVFNANLRHLTASLNNVDPTSPFRDRGTSVQNAETKSRCDNEDQSNNNENLSENDLNYSFTGDLPHRFELPSMSNRARDSNTALQEDESDYGYNNDDIFRLTSPGHKGKPSTNIE